MKLAERVARGAAVAASLLVLAACAGNGSSACIGPIAANAPIAVNPVLVSPAPGATGVSTGPLDVTISSAFNTASLYLKDASGNVLIASNFREANPPAKDVMIGTFTQLASGATYQVYANVQGFGAPFNPCANTPLTVPAPVPVLLGSFTTR